MPDTQGMQDIRSLDIDKTVKGFALTEFIFKNAISNSSTSGDHIRWYQETATDLTATSPSKIANIAPSAKFTHLEHSWTRNTSYVKKYAAESFINMEDMKASDIDVVARTLLRLTRAVAKQVDSDIFDVITESQSATNINEVVTTSVGGDQWDAASYAGDPVKDIMRAVRLIANNGYSVDDLELWVSPTDYESLVAWVFNKGAQAPSVGTTAVSDGSLTKFAGCRVRVSVNVTADYAVVLNPSKAATWKSLTNITAVSIEDKGIGTTYRVYEHGITLLTDPKAVCLITDTQS